MQRLKGKSRGFHVHLNPTRMVTNMLRALRPSKFVTPGPSDRGVFPLPYSEQYTNVPHRLEYITKYIPYHEVSAVCTLDCINGIKTLNMFKLNQNLYNEISFVHLCGAQLLKFANVTNNMAMAEAVHMLPSKQYPATGQ